MGRIASENPRDSLYLIVFFFFFVFICSSFDFYNAVKLEFIICKSKTGTKVSKSFLASALFFLVRSSSLFHFS